MAQSDKQSRRLNLEFIWRPFYLLPQIQFLFLSRRGKKFGSDRRASRISCSEVCSLYWLVRFDGCGSVWSQNGAFVTTPCTWFDTEHYLVHQSAFPVHSAKSVKTNQRQARKALIAHSTQRNPIELKNSPINNFAPASASSAPHHTSS